MHFKALAMPREQFDAWVRRARQTPATLDQGAYAALAKPSFKTPPTTYGGVAPGLFDSIADSYMAGRMSQAALLNSGPLCKAPGASPRSKD